jgi:peptidyl-dipeptidase A
MGLWSLLSSSLLLLPALQALPQFYPVIPLYPVFYPVPVIQWTVLPVPLLKTISEEETAKIFVERAERELEADASAYQFANWNYQTNLTDENQKVKLAAAETSGLLSKRLGKEAQGFDVQQITDVDIKRKLKLIKDLGTSALPDENLKKYNKLLSDMGSTFSKAKVPQRGNSNVQFSLEPEITEVMAKSRDPSELQYYWEQFREASGKKIRANYVEHVDLLNEAAKLNGFRDASKMKVDVYESDTFMEEMEATWEGLKPLYSQLHAYVRNKLLERYGGEVVSATGALPAHLLGNMWAQSWNNIADMLTPYPAKPSIDVTEAMVSQGWTQKKMFEKAEDFFLSLGLEPMPAAFWEKSVLEKPTDGRDLTCHASAWDFQNGQDYRIKQCTRVNQEDFLTVNHEMGHVQYFLQYSNLSFLYRDGANPGFHEGVADILSLAVGNAEYFQSLGLVGQEVDVTDEETNINLLFGLALDRIAFLPFSYMIDKFRWDVYSGLASKEDMNCHWWKLRHSIQGLQPPTTRSKDQFDAGAKYHVAAGIGYVRYFTALIYKFQFFRSMCLESGSYVPGDPSKPLHRCNFYGSKAAGRKLSSMLEMGRSRPWKEAMEVMTGQDEMSTGAIREYFLPLEQWLVERNRRDNVTVGWGEVEEGMLCQ